MSRCPEYGYPAGPGSAGVDSFAGRTGAVVPQAGDYAAFYMSPSDIVSTDGSTLVTPAGSGVDLATQWSRYQFSDSTGVPVVTSNPPASAITYLTLDDGAGGDIVLDATKTWELVGSVFFIVTARP